MIKNQNTQEMILLLGLKKKDDDAFQSLYRDYSKSLLGIILKIIKNTEQAEDILQDTFIQIFSKIDFLMRTNPDCLPGWQDWLEINL